MESLLPHYPYELVNQDALANALGNDQLCGAGINVCEVEPIEEDSPHKKLPHVILTPHVVWYSEESKTDLKRRAAEDVVRVLRGECVKFNNLSIEQWRNKS